jgi:hypothetical protein
MLYYNDDVDIMISFCELLKEQLNESPVLKGNFLYTREDIVLPSSTNVIIKKYDDYLYYVLNETIDVSLSSRSFTAPRKVERLDVESLGEFSYTEKGFFPAGNCVVLYFSSKHNPSPLDVIYTINKSIILESEYFDITLDYLIFKDKLIYYILFRYSLKLENNLSEIIKVRDGLVNSFSFTECDEKNNIFPKEQVEFESKYLAGFSSFDCTSGLSYEGMSTHSPAFNTSARSVVFK